MNSKRGQCLFDLPPELKIQIYENVLIEDGAIINASSFLLPDHDVNRRIKELLRQPSITRVSKAIRNETLPIFYGCNLFQINLAHPKMRTCQIAMDWLHCIGSNNRQMLKSVWVWCMDPQRITAGDDVVNAFAERDVYVKLEGFRRNPHSPSALQAGWAKMRFVDNKARDESFDGDETIPERLMSSEEWKHWDEWRGAACVCQ